MEGSRLFGPFGWPQSGPHPLLEDRLRAAFARALRSDLVGDLEDLRFQLGPFRCGWGRACLGIRSAPVM